ncbi:MAG: hypothetical protein ABSG38_12155 [Spirochaetia bacterium]|jgi:hypothetical protein
MFDEPQYFPILGEPYLDFKKIESREVSLDWLARKQIYLVCEDFLSSARMYDYAPPLDAEASRNKARDLCKKARSAKKALSDLSVCSYDAVLHDFNLFVPEEGNAYLSKVKRAIRLVRKIEEQAEKRSLELHHGGRPEFWDFKRLAAELYRIYMASGGVGKVIWDKSRKCYKGRPMFFIRRVIDQIQPLVPETVMKKFLPEKDSALSRTAAEAIKELEKREAKMWEENRRKLAIFLPSSEFDSPLNQVIRSTHEQPRNHDIVH